MKAVNKNDHYLIGVDSGSTGIKAVALLGGRITACAHTRMVYREDGGICEYDAEAYYDRIAGLIRELTLELPRDAVCDGISLVSASGNTLLLKDGKALLPIFSWRDNRGSEDMEAVLGPVSEAQIHESVGWHKVPKFPLAQLSWIRRNRPEALEQANRICEASSYINYRLCGEWAMDHSSATTFYLQDQKKLCWNPETLRLLDIPEYKLPKLVPVGAKIGYITAAASEDTGLTIGTPVVAGCYDGAGAARSAGILRDDQMLISCGTSWVSIYSSKSRRYLLDLGTMVDPYLEQEGRWIGMTSLGECDIFINRILDTIIPENRNRYEEFSRLSAESVPGAHGLLINPMRFRQNGSLSGYPVSDVCRALMEGIVYSVKRQMQSIQQGHGRLDITHIYMSGGPSNSCIWPQIVSDIMNKPVQVSFGSNACAAGAAMIAGIGSGVFCGLHDARSRLREEVRSYTPDPAAVAFHQQGYLKFTEKFPGLDENMH